MNKKIMINLSPLILMGFLLSGCSDKKEEGGETSGGTTAGETTSGETTAGTTSGATGGEADAKSIVTVTLSADLTQDTLIKVSQGTYNKDLSVNGSCLKLRLPPEGGTENVTISSVTGETSNTLCNTGDENQENDCNKSYNVTYKEGSTTELVLEETELNNSANCEEIFPVYTLLLDSSLNTKIVTVTNTHQTKSFKAGSCIKFSDTWFPNHIDVGEGEENRKVLCSKDSTACERGNYKIWVEVYQNAVYAVPGGTKTIQLSPATAEDLSSNTAECEEWF